MFDTQHGIASRISSKQLVAVHVQQPVQAEPRSRRDAELRRDAETNFDCAEQACAARLRSATRLPARRPGAARARCSGSVGSAPALVEISALEFCRAQLSHSDMIRPVNAGFLQGPPIGSSPIT